MTGNIVVALQKCHPYTRAKGNPTGKLAFRSFLEFNLVDMVDLFLGLEGGKVNGSLFKMASRIRLYPFRSSRTRIIYAGNPGSSARPGKSRLRREADYSPLLHIYQSDDTVVKEATSRELKGPRGSGQNPTPTKSVESEIHQLYQELSVRIHIGLEIGSIRVRMSMQVGKVDDQKKTDNQAKMTKTEAWNGKRLCKIKAEPKMPESDGLTEDISSQFKQASG
ncbi:hypothetical protein Tco_0355242 [Tanacetum coccineum]